LPPLPPPPPPPPHTPPLPKSQLYLAEFCHGVQLKSSKAHRMAVAKEEGLPQGEPQGTVTSELGITEDLRPAALMRSVCSWVITENLVDCLPIKNPLF
jgi:hypothetical protein